MGLFFVSCPLEFEPELVIEIKSFWFEMMDLDGLPTREPWPEFEVIQGGVEIECTDHLGFQINLFSKIANRVLLRIAKFEARYYDQYEKSLQKIDLAKWLDFDYLKSILHVKVESHKSRLNNEKNILEATQNVFTKKNIKINSESMQTLYIRLDKDRVVLSLDTSGEHLHRRGYAEHRGEAPIRETLAAYLIKQLKHHVDLKKDITIVDPFAGSGTILFEALSHNKVLFDRRYSWLSFKTTAKIFKSSTWTKNIRWLQDSENLKCYAYDIDDKAIHNLNHNKVLFEKIFQIKNAQIQTEVADSYDIDLTQLKSMNPVWIVTNPPYGIRMSDNQALDILHKLEKQVDGMVVIHPDTWYFQFENLKLVDQKKIANQGLKLSYAVFRKKLNHQIDQVN